MASSRSLRSRPKRSAASGAVEPGEVDVEPRHRGLDLGPRPGLEGELALQGARHARGEELLLVPVVHRTERGERLARGLVQPLERLGHAVPGQMGDADARLGERRVVRPHRRHVRSFARGDVEDAVVVPRPEDAAGQMEEQEVEGGLEAAGEMGLDVRGADGAQVVGKADAHPGRLAGLGLGVGGGAACGPGR